MILLPKMTQADSGLDGFAKTCRDLMVRMPIGDSKRSVPTAHQQAELNASDQLTAFTLGVFGVSAALSFVAAGGRRAAPQPRVPGSTVCLWATAPTFLRFRGCLLASSAHRETDTDACVRWLAAAHRQMQAVSVNDKSASSQSELCFIVLSCRRVGALSSGPGDNFIDKAFTAMSLRCLDSP